MDPISNLGKTMELLRRQMAERTRKSGAGSASAEATRAQLAEGSASVEKRVMLRLGRLDPDETAFGSKASRIFLDEVLGNEFGIEAWNTAEFQKLFDGIQAEWQGDGDLTSALRDLARQARR